MILNLVTAEPHKFSATIAVTYPAGATCKLVNNDTSEEETATTTTGSYTFKATKGGSYKVVAIENGGDQRTATSDNFTVSDGGSYSKTLVFPEVTFSATVGVTFPAGLTCSLTDGTTTLYSSGTSGTYNFTVPNTGVWTAKASGCQDESISVTTKGAVYTLKLRQSVTVTITGNNNGSGVAYDGISHTVTGYTASISGSSTYTVNDFEFSGQARATRTHYVENGTSDGKTLMGLKASQFTNTNDNFRVTFSVTDGYVKVKQKDVTVKADNKSKTYGDSDPTFTVTIEGRVSASDTISYTISRTSGESPGSYTITPTGTRSQGDYYVTFKTGTLTITGEEPPPVERTTITVNWTPATGRAISVYDPDGTCIYALNQSGYIVFNPSKTGTYTFIGANVSPTPSTVYVTSLYGQSYYVEGAL